MDKSHLFVIDPLASLNRALDSSLRLMFALTRLDHSIFTCEPRHLSRRAGQCTTAACQPLAFAHDPTQFTAGQTQVRSLNDFSAVHMRKDPPYDLDYISTTWLLDGAAPGTRVYNRPEALRRFNEKLAILEFPNAIAPALASANPTELADFIAEVAMGDGILKPLTLYGGRGVTRLRLQDRSPESRSNLVATLTAATNGGTSMRLVQPFDHRVFDGEVRAFAAFGQPIAWCLKVPTGGEFLANTRAGARLSTHTPTNAERQCVQNIAATLQGQGIAFIGFDLIGGQVSEINITSPRLLQAPDDKANYYERLAELTANDLASKH